jgi:hypothetical protein
MSIVDWRHAHPVIFEHNFFNAIVDQLGTPYELGGSGATIDCSGLFIASFSTIGTPITDRTAAELVTDIFTLRKAPIRGPVIKVSFGDGAESDHIAFHATSRMVIHATDDSDFVSLNGGNDGAMATRFVDYWRLMKAKISSLGIWYLDFGALLELTISEG